MKINLKKLKLVFPAFGISKDEFSDNIGACQITGHTALLNEHQARYLLSVCTLQELAFIIVGHGKQLAKRAAAMV